MYFSNRRLQNVKINKFGFILFLADFIKTRDAQLCDDIGGTTIESASECNAAAAALGIVWVSACNGTFFY